jgi:glycosyltransferase involved in cell wall biosynthesis
MLLNVDRLPSDHMLGDAEPNMPRPLLWEDLVYLLAVTLTGQPPTRLNIKSLLARRSGAISWGPSATALLAATLGRPLAYLCWGVPKQSKYRLWDVLRRWRLEYLLRRANVVLANDALTARQIEEMCGRPAIQVPYIVDTDFFGVNHSVHRSDTILAPGNNDRDETLLRDLASAGHRVVRVTYDKLLHAKLRIWYGAQPNIELRYAVPYAELRSLYQSARLVLLPITSQNHPAGQTSILEALACGTLVLVSRGRTSAAFDGYPGVTVLDSNSPQTWDREIKDARALISGAATNPERLHEFVASRHAPYVVQKSLEHLLKAILSERPR